MNALWSEFSSVHLEKIGGWRRQIADITSPGVLFYPFSGPDFAYADALFPGARDYVLCGLETVDQILGAEGVGAGDDESPGSEGSGQGTGLPESTGTEEDTPCGGEFESRVVYHPESSGYTLVYFPALRGVAIIDSTVVRQV